ncbi:SpoIIE family protein phosphatase [Streptomyces sp. SCSIO ZS0520]|uniref:SpoIIE family protein phosphatase n=1 Tax=Streptomyces sp. SCSIO ZS0520 TaxID=2892996 RepID=UPI0021DAA91C|nr:SpoIIE family protein phosphatase [Streptomyces sp. SCSIO ZS0520]
MAGDGGPANSPKADPGLLGKLLDTLETGVFVQDGAGTITSVSPRAEELLGRGAAELIGRDAHDHLHRTENGAPLQRSACRLTQAFLSGQTLLSGTEWFARGDGGVIAVTCLMAPFADPREPGGAVLFFEAPDLTAEGAGSSSSDVADRLALVAESTTVLTSSLDTDKALRALVGLIVPRLADWAVVDLIGEEGEVRRVAVVRYWDGEYVNMEEFLGPLPAASGTSRMPLSQALRGGAAVLVRAEDYAVPPDSPLTEIQQDFFRSTGMHSAVIAPLRAMGGTGGRIIGALTVGRADQKRPFGATDLALVDDIARRAGLAVDNAQLYEGQRRVAENMQRHLLPPMPKILGMDVCARYEPAPHASKVGGDWYDAFPLPDGSVAMVIGDVVGHDLAAAAYMSQVRNMLRAFAWGEETSPGAVVSRLDRALGHISDAPMATMVMGRLEGPEGGPWRLRWTNAGHPPPLVVRHDGRTDFLQGGAGMLLGTDLPSTRTDAVTALSPHSTVVLYTDGLVETRSSSLQDGLTRLSAHASWLAQRPLDEFCDRLIDLTRPVDNHDDIALIALRPVPGAGPESRAG